MRVWAASAMSTQKRRENMKKRPNRHEFLTSQSEDLKAAAADLSVLKELDTLMEGRRWNAQR